jgi:hypothetical protein
MIRTVGLLKPINFRPANEAFALRRKRETGGHPRNSVMPG